MDKHQINEQIRENSFLVIDDQGEKLGQLSKHEALAVADEKGLDLVLIVPSYKNNGMGIAKILDYGKMMYEQKIKERQSRKNNNEIKVKEIKVRPQIADNDLKWMAKNASNWLKENNQVKFKIRAYGRIGYKPELINETYNKFLELVGDVGKVQNPLKKITPVLYESLLVKNK